MHASYATKIALLHVGNLGHSQFWHHRRRFLGPHNISQGRIGSSPQLWQMLRCFRLTNASATFCTLMNKLFQPFLDQFVVMYLNDIVVYSRTMEEHVQHLRQVFQVLRDNELYIKLEKCSFAKPEVEFLGHWIREGRLMMDQTKVHAILDWKTKIPELRSFLGFVYYRRFIKWYSSVAAPLTNLLKKSQTWQWSKKCQQVFDRLKEAVSKEPVMTLADHTKPFEVHTDASYFAIGGVLM